MNSARSVKAAVRLKGSKILLHKCPITGTMVNVTRAAVGRIMCLNWSTGHLGSPRYESISLYKMRMKLF
jgi:hypothetical protein